MNKFVNSSRADGNNIIITNNVNNVTKEEENINSKKENLEKLRMMNIDRMETEIEYHVVRRKLNFEHKHN